MFSSLFNKSRDKNPAPCWCAGLFVNSCCRRMEAALVAVHEWETGVHVEIGHGLSVDFPDSLHNDFAEQWQPLLDGKRMKGGNDKGMAISGRVGLDSAKDAAVVSFRGMTPRLRQRSVLTDIQTEVVGELLSRDGIAPADLLAVGVYDPGVWFVGQPSGKEVAPSQRNGTADIPDGPLSPVKPEYCEPLSDTVGLATRSGHNVVDAFPAMDVAVGGQGGPLLPLPYWVLLHSPERDRLVLDLGQEARFTFLPKSSSGKKSHIGYGFAGACGSLIDPIVRGLTNGEQSYDNGGCLAVQGTILPELIALMKPWEGNEFLSTLSQWSPLAPLCAADLVHAIHGQVQRKNWSLSDVLATVVESVALRIARFCPHQTTRPSPPEWIIIGNGQRHNLMRKRLEQQLGFTEKHRIELPGLLPGYLDAAAIAVLTSLTVRQIPGNLPHLTGAESERVLGRIIPGSAENWQKLLQIMVDIPPAVRSLHSTM